MSPYFKKAAKAYRQKDYAEALKWYRLAADEGDVEAINDLGVMYAE